MITVDSKAFSKNFGFYRQKALVEPVGVSNYGRPSVVVLNDDEYNRLKKLDRQARSIEEISDYEADLLASSRMAEKHIHLNDLMD
jgi:hypothetical protein